MSTQSRKESDYKYHQSVKGKLARKRYIQSIKGQIAKKRYDKSEKCKETVKKYRSSIGGNIIVNKHGKKYRLTMRLKVLSLFGNKCIKCGFSDTRALQLDHINGGGSKQNKLVSWSKRYRELLSGVNLDKYQLLCANCNFIKRDTNNEMVKKLTIPLIENLT